MESLIRNRPKLKWDADSHNSFTNDYSFVEVLRRDYKIIAEGIGTAKTSRRQNKILVKPFLLNKFETFYLYEK